MSGDKILLSILGLVLIYVTVYLTMAGSSLTVRAIAGTFLVLIISSIGASAVDMCRKKKDDSE